MIRTDTSLFEELDVRMKQLSNQTDELRNVLNYLISEMEQDAEFLLYEKSSFICERTTEALKSLDKVLTICDGLGLISASLPSRFKEVERRSANKISDMMSTLSQLKAVTASSASAQLSVIPDCYDFESDSEADALSERVSACDISLVTSVVNAQLKITAVEDSEEL